MRLPSSLKVPWKRCLKGSSEKSGTSRHRFHWPEEKAIR